MLNLKTGRAATYEGILAHPNLFSVNTKIIFFHTTLNCFLSMYMVIPQVS
jgi:hypothetical protein